jgi:hypothetical protein
MGHVTSDLELIALEEPGMRPQRAVFGLAAIALLSTTAIATYNSSGPRTSRVGPGWFQAFSMFGGTATMLTGIVASVAFVQPSRSGRDGPPGLHLGLRTLRVGATLLVAGVLWLVLSLLGLIPSPVLLIASVKVPPVLIAIGAVLLRNSAVAIRQEAADPLTILTLGKATFRTGLVLLLLGYALPMAIRQVDQGLGMFGTVIEMDCIPAGMALVILGNVIEVVELSTRREQGSTTPG